MALAFLPPPPYPIGMAALKNPRHEKFARVYAYGQPITEAYNLAFGRTEGNSQKAAANKACELMKRPEIAARVIEIRESLASKAQYTQDHLFKDALAMMTFDKRELMDIRHGACRYCYGDGHQYHWKEREFIQAVEKAERAGEPLPDIAGGFGFKRLAEPNPDCPECEGAGVVVERFADSRTYSPTAAMAFEGFEPTANGIKLKTIDRAPFANIVSKMLGVADKRVLTGPNDGPIKIDVSGLSETALEELAALAPND